MRKSNWIIIAILVLASVLFLGAWYYLGFYRVDAPYDLIIAAIWWVLIIVVCICIHWAEKRRQERVRTMYLAPGVLFNPE